MTITKVIAASILGGLCHSGVGQSFAQIGPESGSANRFFVYGTDSDGSVVTGVFQSGNLSREFNGFRYNADDGFEVLTGDGEFGGGSEVFASNSTGEIVVGVATRDLRGRSPGVASRWDARGQWHSLGTLASTVGNASVANDINGVGNVIVGQSSSGTGDEAFVWTDADGMVGLGHLGASFTGVLSSTAEVISNSGDIIAGTSTSEHSIFGEAFVWTEQAGMIGLGTLDGSGATSFAKGMSRDGGTIVGFSSSNSGLQAFRWTDTEGMVGLGFLGDDNDSSAFDASPDGSFIVGRSGRADRGTAFLWTEAGGMMSLKDVIEESYGINLTGWQLTTATGISDDGNVIVGVGVNPSGNVRGWAFTVPTPSTTGVVLLGFGVFGRRIRDTVTI